MEDWLLSPISGGPLEETVHFNWLYQVKFRENSFLNSDANSPAFRG